MIGKIIQTTIKIWVLGIASLFFALVILNFPMLIVYAFNLEYFGDIFQAIYFYIISPFLLGFFLYAIFFTKNQKK